MKGVLAGCRALLHTRFEGAVLQFGIGKANVNKM